MIISSYESFKWRELWKVTERRAGAVYNTQKTEFHVPNTWKPFGDWITVSISTSETRKPELTINPHPEFV